MNTNLKPESLANVEWCWLASGHTRDVTSLKPGDVVLEVTCEGDHGWRLPTVMERAALHDLTRVAKAAPRKKKAGDTGQLEAFNNQSDKG